MAGDLYDTLEETALAHVKAYESPNAWDEEAIWKLRTPDCLHYLHPTESLPPQFAGPVDQTHHRAFMNFFGPIINKNLFEVKDLVVDVKKRIVVLRLAATFDFKAIGDEPEEKDFKADYVWLTEMDESGKKIVRVEEYLDNQRLIGHVRGKAERYAELHK